jgi:hypothetical protein
MTAPAPASGLETALALALADELVDLTRLLDDLILDLVAHPETVRRHMHSLQAVDRVTQTQLAIAALLRAGDAIDEAVAAVPLGEMAARVRARLAEHRAQSAPAASGACPA